MYVLHCHWNLFVTIIYSDFHIVLYIIRHSQCHVIIQSTPNYQIIFEKKFPPWIDSQLVAKGLFIIFSFSPFMWHIPFFKLVPFLFSFSSYLCFVSFFSSFYVPWFLGERWFFCKILICCDHLCIKNSNSYFKTIV
jgi:hypothetical protein